MPGDYKYDVAFSFLADDEALAIEIADRIRDRVSVFIYSERQKELIGSDGIDQFSNVFSEDSRLVVVLYREQWGQTKWTRIEETAIKTRWLDGFEFLLMVPLDSPAKLPKWYPPTWIWADIKRYGIDGVAGVIEVRVQTVGGNVKSDTAVDHALRLDREKSFLAKRNSWRYSDQFSQRGEAEAERFVQELECLAGEIRTQTQLQIGFEHATAGHCVLSIDGLRLLVESYSPSIADSPTFVLHVWTLEGGRFLGPYTIDEPTKIDEGRYAFDLDLSERVGWSLDDRFFPSGQLADVWIKKVVGHISEKNKRAR
jgi:hypothetical protein